MRALLLIILFPLFACPSFADDRPVTVDTRPGVSVAAYYMKRDGASAAVVLLPGGEGDLRMRNGVPTSDNFLVRSREFFAASGFTVLVMGTPVDKAGMGYPFRTGKKHVDDMEKVVEFVKRDSGLPTWLIGTSRGTFSAVAAAVSFGNQKLAGIVLTSSMTGNKKIPGVVTQGLDAIRIPVLVMHHAKDSCPACDPGEVAKILGGLTNAPVKKLIMVDGGTDPKGDPCGARHWHGYAGMEKEAVGIISNWIKSPNP